MTFAPPWMTKDPSWMPGGPSWLPQGQRTDPFGMTTPQAGGIQGLLRDPNFALALLANSRGQRFGQALGTAGLQASQMGQQRQDDALRQEYMRAQIQRMQQPEAGRQPASVQEYEYAKQNGFKGSFQDWVAAGGQSSRPSAITVYDYWKNLPSDKEREEMLMTMRAPTVKDIGSVPTNVSNPMAIKPLSSLANEVTGAQAIANAQGVGKAVGEAQGAQTAKAPAKSSMEYVIGQFDPVIEKTMQGMISGPAGRLFDYGDRKRFDNLREQLSTELRTVFRIPGEGTLSDREQAQYGIQLPDTSNPPEVNKAILEDIRARTQLRTETPIGTSPSAPTQRRRKYNPATGNIE